jgi:hypothetical protein
MAENTAHAKVSQTKFLQESFNTTSFFNPRVPPTLTGIFSE